MYKALYNIENKVLDDDTNIYAAKLIRQKLNSNTELITKYQPFQILFNQWEI